MLSEGRGHLILYGIDGSQLLGFMAGLGVLRLLDEEAKARGKDRPTLYFDKSCLATIDVADSSSAIVDLIAGRLEVRRQYYAGALRDISKPADFTSQSFDDFARVASDWQRYALAGLACSTGDDTAESTLCAANGASHQELIRSIRDVLSLVGRDHISNAIFRSWTKSYEVSDELRKSLGLGTRKPTLRLDPADERLYALRATNPTPPTSEFKTELGAQALAIPAFELLPVCPRRHPICISSRSARRENRVFFRWALWSVPTTLAGVRSLLAAGPSDQEASRMRGAFAAFEVARVTGEKGKLSIAPTAGIW
jgi:hypothetical protein